MKPDAFENIATAIRIITYIYIYTGIVDVCFA